MEELILKWSRNELEFGGSEHIHLVEIVPYMTSKQLEFIVSQPISDGVREAAMREIGMRALIKSPWRDRLTISALGVGIIAGALTIWRILSGH